MLPDKILVIATRQIGDVLLSTPLIRSLRRAWPKARLDVLVYEKTGHILQGNSDIDHLIEVAEHPNKSQYWVLLKQIFRRYNLAVSILGGDRPLIYALLAAPQRVSIVPPPQRYAHWKRAICKTWVELDNVSTHTVEQYLQLADALKIERCYDIVLPISIDSNELDSLLPFDRQEKKYAVLHLMPMWRYKRWNPEGWRALIDSLFQQDIQIVITGSPSHQEQKLVNEILELNPQQVVNLAGQLNLAQVAQLITTAALFVGPDTSVTHIAAATGAPTLAIFGPSNPVKWGPWPKGYDKTAPPFVNHAEVQHVGNVYLLQGARDCVPCHEEGCDRHKGSASRCLDELPANRVIDAAKLLLNPNLAKH